MSIQTSFVPPLHVFATIFFYVLFPGMQWPVRSSERHVQEEWFGSVNCVIDKLGSFCGDSVGEVVVSGFNADSG